MTEPIDRRRFIGHSLAAAIALEIAANTSLAASTVEALLAQADPRLIPDVPAAPVEQNGYYLLERLAKGISDGPPYDLLTDGAWEYEDAFSPVKPDAARDLKLGKWADENPAAVDRIIEALRVGICCRRV